MVALLTAAKVPPQMQNEPPPRREGSGSGTFAHPAVQDLLGIRAKLCPSSRTGACGFDKTMSERLLRKQWLVLFGGMNRDDH